LRKHSRSVLDGPLRRSTHFCGAGRIPVRASAGPSSNNASMPTSSNTSTSYSSVSDRPRTNESGGGRDFLGPAPFRTTGEPKEQAQAEPRGAPQHHTAAERTPSSTLRKGHLPSDLAHETGHVGRRVQDESCRGPASRCPITPKPAVTTTSPPRPPAAPRRSLRIEPLRAGS